MYAYIYEEIIQSEMHIKSDKSSWFRHLGAVKSSERFAHWRLGKLRVVLICFFFSDFLSSSLSLSCEAVLPRFVRCNAYFRHAIKNI